MKQLITFIFCSIICLPLFSQPSSADSLKLQKDSTLRATIHADSIKVEKQFSEMARWKKISTENIYPAIKAGDFSGVVPVSNPTEIPDPKMDYKLLFELTSSNPDSVAKELNYGLVEVARVINLHAASGIPLKKIMPVLVVHAGALRAISNNDYYKKHFRIDNPNLKLIRDLENLGARFIACGQAMAFLDIKKEDLLPDVKISLTAQTALSNYQLKGYVLYDMNMDKR